MTWSSDNKLLLCTNIDVDWPNAQVCQFERKEEQAFPINFLAQHLETLIPSGQHFMISLLVNNSRKIKSIDKT